MRSLTSICALVAALAVPSSSAFATAGWTWPVRGQVVTQYKNGDDPYAAGQHRGIDLAAPAGTPVVAATAGTVAYAGVVGSSGLTVAERTSDGRYELSYLHLSEIAVRRGQAVAAGARLGAVGSSGSAPAEQPHVHFGVRESADRHAYLDPLGFLAPPPSDATEPRPAPVPVAEPVRVAPAPAPIPGLPLAGAAAFPAPAHAPLQLPAQHGAGAHAHGPGHATDRPRASVRGAGSAVARGTAASVGAAARPVGAGAGSLAGTDPSVPARHAGARAAAHPAAHGLSPAALGPAADRVGSPARARSPRAPSRGGIDLGWLAACAGLVAASALLAGPAGGRPRPRIARAAFGALIRAASRS